MKRKTNQQARLTEFLRLAKAYRDGEITFDELTQALDPLRSEGSMRQGGVSPMGVALILLAVAAAVCAGLYVALP